LIARILVLSAFSTFAGAAMAFQGAVRPAQEKPKDPFEVKAALMVLLARHVTWPEKAFERKDSPLKIGLIGKDRFGDHLDKLKGKAVDSHKIEIRRDMDPEKLKDCQIVMVSDSEDGRLEEILEVFRGKPTLALGDSKGFGKRGVGINFFDQEVDGKKTISWELNTEALKKAGLTPSGKLLEIEEKRKNRP